MYCSTMEDRVRSLRTVLDVGQDSAGSRVFISVGYRSPSHVGYVASDKSGKGMRSKCACSDDAMLCCTT